jgi:hypothetical protein
VKEFAESLIGARVEDGKRAGGEYGAFIIGKFI